MWKLGVRAERSFTAATAPRSSVRSPATVAATGASRSDSPCFMAVIRMPSASTTVSAAGSAAATPEGAPCGRAPVLPVVLSPVLPAILSSVLPASLSVALSAVLSPVLPAVSVALSAVLPVGWPAGASHGRSVCVSLSGPVGMWIPAGAGAAYAGVAGRFAREATRRSGAVRPAAVAAVRAEASGPAVAAFGDMPHAPHAVRHTVRSARAASRYRVRVFTT